MRFVVSHRLAGKTSGGRQDSRDAFASAEIHVARCADVRHKRETKASRTVLIVEGDGKELAAEARKFAGDVIVEAERWRLPAVAAPFANGSGADAGSGAEVVFRITSSGTPLAGARIGLTVQNLRDGSALTVRAVTDESGAASAVYDPRTWAPVATAILPARDAWPWIQPCESRRVVSDIPPLPRTGPLGWWHWALGMLAYSGDRGRGIRVGVADTGIGPHPDLAHVTRAGAFINGSHDPAASAAADIEQHGTHVCGTIAARPGPIAGSFAGIAPGAELVAARVYQGSPDRPEASNADISNALDDLSGEHDCDIINLSLGGRSASQIEADALMAAVERGSMVICAAGNDHGAEVAYPAAYPGAVAVSAVGLAGSAPPGALDWATLPPQIDRYAATWYLAGFSDIGPQLACTAPGVGVISTAAGSSGYVSMSGTSMAAAVVSGALAALLSRDPVYRGLPRNLGRSQRAWALLFQRLRSLGLLQIYEGFGMPTVTP